MNEKSFKADIARLKIEFRALEKNIICSRPVTECGVRYDMILDDGKKLYKAQIKYSDSKCGWEGSTKVALEKAKGRGVNRPYNSEEIDVLLVYLPSLDKICWFGPEVFVGKSQLYIRYQKMKYQTKTSLIAQDYLW